MITFFFFTKGVIACTSAWVTVVLGEFRVVLGSSIGLNFFTSILGSSIDLNFPSTTAIQKMRHTWDFSVVLELSTTYMELGTWMLEENYE